mgnify:FL=1
MRIGGLNSALELHGGAVGATGPVRPVSSVGPVKRGLGTASVSSRGPAGEALEDGRGAAALHGRHDGAVLDADAVQEMVDGLNQALQAANKRLQFLVHETTGRIYVKVIDRETEEVIREIPPEKILDLVGRIQELVGLLVDEKV